MLYIQEYSDGKGHYGFEVIEHPHENLELLEISFNEEKIFHSQHMYIVIKDYDRDDLNALDDPEPIYIVSTIYNYIDLEFDYETITIYRNYNDMIHIHTGFLNYNHYNKEDLKNKTSNYYSLYTITITTKYN